MPRPFTDRMRARLASLPHELLLELLVQLASLSAETRQLAENFLAAHNPLPEWAVTRVLLSEDLMSSILAPLEVTDAAAMDVCSTWRMAWRATDNTRRGLRPAAAVPVVTPPLDDYVVDMVALDEERLCLGIENEMRIVNKQMQMLHTIDFDAFRTAVGNGRLYATDGNLTLRAYQLTDYSLAAERVFEDDVEEEDVDQVDITDLALAPGGPLFAVDIGQGRILALDPASLETRFTFGNFDAYTLRSMVIVGNELYVGHQPDHSLRVFSLTGESLREIKGDWREPLTLRFVNERLYLLEWGEHPQPGDSEEVKAAKRMTRRRVFALTPQGETLQIYDCSPHLQEGEFVMSMNVFDGKLLLARGGVGCMFGLRGL